MYIIKKSKKFKISSFYNMKNTNVRTIQDHNGNTTNIEKIHLVAEIVEPYFKFDMDLYGDRGSCQLPKIEELTTLFFKFNGTDRKLILNKEDEQQLLDTIRKLHIGLVEIVKINSLGRYITITM